MANIDKLLEIMAALRDPTTGCPWDLEQTPATIAPHTVEEAYEVQEAIARGSSEERCDELGDLLFQVVFQARLAEEAGEFNFDDIVTAISEKLIRRHPHVFGAEAGVPIDTDTISDQWEAIKAQERSDKSDASGLGGVALALPALLRAAKLGKRAARLEFDWAQPEDVVRQLLAEVTELEAATNAAEQKHELGDILFSAAQLARHHGVSPEEALADANRRFETRFRWMERSAGGTAAFSALDDAQQEQLWNQAKAAERVR